MAYTTTRKKIRSEVNSQVYTGPHNGLAGRDAANAHPMQSITGLEAELASIQSHIGDVDIHYAMNQISITESQISDLQAYLPVAGGTVDFLDVTNNLTVGGRIRINIGSSGATITQLSGMSVEVSGSSNTYRTFQLASSGAGKYFTATNAGRIGIGADAEVPQAVLHVSGDATIDDDLTVGGETILSALAGGGTRTLKIDNNGKVFAE